MQHQEVQCVPGKKCFKKNVPVLKLSRSFEALLEIIAKLMSLVVVYMLFEFVGKWIVGDEFRSDTLLSLVVLPAIYILKDSYIIFEPFFVKISLSDESVSVESGILTKRLDCLNLKTVENVELVTTPIGRLMDYSTLNIYAYGSWVELPHVKSAMPVKESIELGILKRESYE